MWGNVEKSGKEIYGNDEESHNFYIN